MCKICSKLTIKTPELSQLLIRRPAITVKKKRVSHIQNVNSENHHDILFTQLFIITKQLPGFFVVFDTDGSVGFAGATVLVATVVDGVASDTSNDKKS